MAIFVKHKCKNWTTALNGVFMCEICGRQLEPVLVLADGENFRGPPKRGFKCRVCKECGCMMRIVDTEQNGAWMP